MNRLTNQEICDEADSLLDNVLDVQYLTDMASEDFYGRMERDEDTHDDDIDAIFEIVYSRIRNALTKG